MPDLVAARDRALAQPPDIGRQRRRADQPAPGGERQRRDRAARQLDEQEARAPEERADQRVADDEGTAGSGRCIRRHCERSEAIQGDRANVWIASLRSQ
ncbi:hypothetical protein AE618_10270 [Bosea vaviloviae]|uniref:Uncharacterized protein n=1 Tax=Bosea vaviloviae TaxID=1526658 RepID=A0A0N1FIG2_9HYPH|nr:hypothetical protein AE618_10270 [Bosea vaviloviae]